MAPDTPRVTQTCISRQLEADFAGLCRDTARRDRTLPRPCSCVMGPVRVFAGRRLHHSSGGGGKSYRYFGSPGAAVRALTPRRGYLAGDVAGAIVRAVAGGTRFRPG